MCEVLSHQDRIILDGAYVHVDYLRKALAAAVTVSPRATADVERDGARYRWLVDYANHPEGAKAWPVQDWVGGWKVNKPDLDEAIDAAIAATKPGETDT